MSLIRATGTTQRTFRPLALVVATAALALSCSDTLASATPLTGDYVLERVVPPDTFVPFGQYDSITRVADTVRFSGTAGVWITVVKYSGPNGDLQQRGTANLRVFAERGAHFVEFVCPINAGCLRGPSLAVSRGEGLALMGNTDMRIYKRIPGPFTQ